MRDDDEICWSLFNYIDLEDRDWSDHPLRQIREIGNAGLAALSGDFAALYSGMGRPSVLFRWFVGIGIDDPVWDHSRFSKNCDRLLEGEIAAKFLEAVLSQPRGTGSVTRAATTRSAGTPRSGAERRRRKLQGTCTRGIYDNLWTPPAARCFRSDVTP